MGLDYGVFYRREMRTDLDWSEVPRWDFFISAYNRSERLRGVYDRVRAGVKLWLIHPEYSLTQEDYPSEWTFAPVPGDESSFVRSTAAYLAECSGFDVRTHSLCVDITGLMRPHILFFLRWLEQAGARRVDMIYAEPVRYTRKEKTTFSAGSITEVRPVHGYEGSPNGTASADLLIIGMGYDDRMIAEVSEDRGKAEKFQLFGLPSLRADMYQESVIRSRAAADSLADPDFVPRSRGFAPANDPFATASALNDVLAAKGMESVTNLYLSPLGTKAQTLGFGLFYVGQLRNRSASIIYPFSTQYEAETSVGLSRAWMYTVEFPIF